MDSSRDFCQRHQVSPLNPATVVERNESGPPCIDDGPEQSGSEVSQIPGVEVGNPLHLVSVPRRESHAGNAEVPNPTLDLKVDPGVMSIRTRTRPPVGFSEDISAFVIVLVTSTEDVRVEVLEDPTSRVDDLSATYINPAVSLKRKAGGENTVLGVYPT